MPLLLLMLLVDCTSLTWLNLAHNYLESLDGVHCLTNLVGKSDIYGCSYYYHYNIVLNASHNIITNSGNLAPLKSKPIK